ncbi:hypothetical protein [Enterococcus mundtii]|uniref:hypothetical protein n=1 Tax=Enterococcus mundtii TaxID=53346 RepID=UPI00030AD32F|nr:hypothetical protein [Enterococcus mundtii]
MKRVLMGVTMLFGLIVSGMHTEVADAAIRAIDPESIVISKEDNQKAVQQLEEQGIDVDNLPFSKDKLTIQKPKAGTYIIEGEDKNPKDNLSIAEELLPKAKLYSINATGFSVQIYNPSSGSTSSASGIRCNELAPLFTIEDNGIAGIHAIMSYNQFYFLGDYVQDYGTGIWDGGYYYRYFNISDTKWQWYRRLWLSVADKNDLLN